MPSASVISEPHLATLPDGSKLSYSVFGDPSLNRTVIYFHGFPGSRIEAAGSHQKALAKGISIVALDRPGFGYSSFLPDHTPVSFVPRVAAFCDLIGITRFAVLGVSGGAPYALTCAAKLKARVQGALIVSGVSEYDPTDLDHQMTRVNRALLTLGRRAPRIASLIVRVLGRWWQARPQDMLRWMRVLLCLEDRKILRASGRASLLERNLSEALRQGTRGAALEFVRLCAPWDVAIEEIECPVQFMHGDEDWYVPISMARRSAQRVQRSEIQVFLGHGHFMALSNVAALIDALEGLTRALPETIRDKRLP